MKPFRTFHPALVSIPLFTFLYFCPSAILAADSPPFTYRHIRRMQPLALQIHVLKIDMQAPGISLAVSALPDPDGDGPAETGLALPLDHARRGRLSAGVNANAWEMTPDPKTGEKPGYVVGGPCDVLGLVARDGKHFSPPEAYWSFWLDADGKPDLGPGTTAPKAVRLAISGFGHLVRNGKSLIGPAAQEPRHPRTALGLSQDKRFLTLAVIDGRQPGTSEGLSERELAGLMVELGCHDAFNLDGGGSSVMIVRDQDDEPRIVNRPSDKTDPRPIPVFFGVRLIGKKEPQ